MHNSSDKDKKVTVFSVVMNALGATFRRLWFIFILLLVGAIAAALLELVPPLLLKRVIDSYLNVGQLDGLWRMATLYVLATVGSSIISFGLVFINSFIGQNLILELRFAMADHLTKLPMSYYNRTALGDTMSRLTSDAETVSSIFGGAGGGGGGPGGLSTLPVDVVKAIAILITMFALSPGLTLIVLVAAPVVYLVSAYFRRNTYRLQLQVRRTVGAINAFLQETFSGMRIVKAYGKEEQYDGQFQRPLGNNLKAANATAVYDSWFPVVMQIIRVVVIAAVIWFGAKTGVNTRLAITIGGLAAMADLVGRLFTPIEALAQDFQTLQQALAGLKRISELLMEKPEEKGITQHIAAVSPAANQNAAEIRDISFSYVPGKPILKNVSLSLPQGRKIAIVGRTGAGKTTLMSLIAGLYGSDSGTISVMGYNPHLVDPKDRRKLLGVVPQNVHIFEGTIRENITLRDGQIPLEAVEKAAQMVGLHEYIKGLEKGYDTLLGVGGTRLSFGQGQLLSMARAIVSDPALLLLDEPTSGMDAVTEAAIFSAFRNISKDRSLITISHRLSGIVDADEVHIMASGRIVQSGTPEKLAGESGWYSVFRQLEDLGWKMD